jgi:hypothetical protein
MKLDPDAGVTVMKLGYRMAGEDVHQLVQPRNFGAYTGAADEAYVTLSFRLANDLGSSRTITPSITVETADVYNNFSAVTAHDSTTLGVLAASTDSYYEWTFRIDDIPNPEDPRGLQFEITLTVGGGVVTTGDVYFGNVILEQGTGRSDFVELPYAEELLTCQRYYEKTFDFTTAPAQNAGIAGALITLSGGDIAIDEGISTTWEFEAVKVRNDYELTFYNPLDTNDQWRNITDNNNASTASSTINGHDTRGRHRVGITNAGVLTASDDSDTMAIHVTCDAEFDGP